MNCESFLEKCKARCCCLCPLPKKTWEKCKKYIVKEPDEVLDVPDFHGEKMVLPATKDLKCVFLKEDFHCAIYKQRPWICKNFGSEKDPMLVCPYQDKNGVKRNTKEM